METLTDWITCRMERGKEETEKYDIIKVFKENISLSLLAAGFSSQKGSKLYEKWKLNRRKFGGVKINYQNGKLMEIKLSVIRLVSGTVEASCNELRVYGPLKS